MPQVNKTTTMTTTTRLYGQNTEEEEEGEKGQCLTDTPGQ